MMLTVAVAMLPLRLFVMTTMLRMLPVLTIQLLLLIL
jgi:hypothetical protein